MQTDTEIKKVFECLRKAYADLDYYAFCELLKLNPEYDMKYFTTFQNGVRSLCELDNSKLVTLVAYGGQKI